MIYPLLDLFIVAWGTFFFILILSTPHDRPLAKYMLLVFVVAQITTPLGVFFPLTEGMSPTVVLYLFLYNLFYLSGPAFYFYIKALRSPSFRFRPRHLWHLVPVFTIPPVFYGFLFQYDDRYPIASLQLLTMTFWFLVYLIAGLRLLPGHWWSFQEWFAEEKNVIWRWLYIPVLFYTGVYLIRVGVHTLEVLAPRLPDVGTWHYALTLSARIIFFYLVGVGSYRHRHLCEARDEEMPDQAALAEESQAEDDKYRKSALEEQRIQELWQKLNQHMSEDEPFRDIDLKLGQLAQNLGVTTNELSQVINTCTGQKFHDFVNQYRVNKARALIEQYADSPRSMLDLSLEAGFGNTGTFYKYFKKHLAVTPVQYRRSHQAR